MFNFKGMFEISPRWLNRNAPDKVTHIYSYRHKRGETHAESLVKTPSGCAAAFQTQNCKAKTGGNKRKTFMPAWKTTADPGQRACVCAADATAAGLIDSFLYCSGIYRLSYSLWERTLKWFVSMFVRARACISVLHTSVTFIRTFACVCVCLHPY